MMKYLLYLLVVLCLTACKSTKNTKKPNLDISALTLKEGCPSRKDVKCTAQVMPNKRIVYRKEQSTGNLVPKFITDSSYNVLHFEFKRIPDKRMTDAQYREEVYFEVPQAKSSLHLADEDLQNVHFLFGRFCFCDRSTVGFFKVSSGKLNLQDGQLSFSIENNQVPQRLEPVKASYQTN